jgi:hypothetical protein
MFRTQLLSQAVRLILTPHRDLDDRIDAGAFYIGLGDQFDDDRRRVRALVRALRPGETSDVGRCFLSSHPRRQSVRRPDRVGPPFSHPR